MDDSWEPDGWEPDDQIGGLAAPTSWPLRRGQAIDVWFNQSQDAKDGLFNAGYYRGTIDKVTAPSATGIQKATIDFPDDFTTAKVDLKKSQLYKPGTQPEKPTEEQGEVAVEVTTEDLPGVDDSSKAYGLSENQLKVLKNLWYEQGHYAGVSRMWRLLKDKAEAAGAEPFYGIHNRQLRSWIAAQESKQLFAPVKAPKTYRPFELPAEPLRNLQMDTLDIGKTYAGKEDGKQRWVQVIVDPASRYVWATIRSGTSVPAWRTTEGLVSMLKELREGVLRHGDHAFNVFDENGALVRKLRAAVDGGPEFKPGQGRSFDDYAFEKLRDAGLVSGRGMFTAKVNLASAPNQAAYVERMNSTIRQKIRLAIQSEQGSIRRTAAKEARKRDGYAALIKRAVAAINDEVATSTGMTPNEYMRSYLAKGVPKVEEGKPMTEDQKRKVEARADLEQQKKLVEGTRVRLVNLSREKAELLGQRKLEARWSEQVYEIDKRIKRGADTDVMAYEYRIRQTNGVSVKGTYKREQLLVIPTLETEYLADRTQKGSTAKLKGVIPRVESYTDADGKQKWRSAADGSSWAEKEVAKIQDIGGLSKEKVLWRLVAYLRQGNSKEVALRRLKDSLVAPDPKKEKVAILNK